MISKNIKWGIILIFLLINMILSYIFNMKVLWPLLILNIFLYILLKKWSFEYINIIFLLSISITIFMTIMSIYCINLNAYRLSDLVIYHNNSDMCYSVKQLKNKVLQLYPNSIGAFYVKMTNKANDFYTLNNIINKYQNNFGIDDTNNVLAIHLRLGDKLIEKKYLLPVKIIDIFRDKKYITKSNSSEYIINYINTYFRNTPKIIYYGFHVKLGVKETKKFINELCKNILNYKIVNPSSSYFVADKHLCEMVNAKHFVITAESGYATLIKNIRKERGKETISLV